jgi:hypothetical protein
MAEADCPDCGKDEKGCVYCCSHGNTEIKTITDKRYMREICECLDCGYYEVLNELDYYTEFPCL